MFEIVKDQESHIFIPDSFDDHDLTEGIGKHYNFTYAMSSIAAAGLLGPIFGEQKFNKFGFYYFKIYVLGEEKLVYFDDQVPAIIDSYYRPEPLFCHLRQKSHESVVQIWPQLILKGLAKHLGSYMRALSLGILEVFDLLVPHLKLELELNSLKIVDIIEGHVKSNNLVLLTEKALDRKTLVDSSHEQVGDEGGQRKESRGPEHLYGEDRARRLPVQLQNDLHVQEEAALLLPAGREGRRAGAQV